MRANIDLVMTSPPFALTRKKDYGNKQEDDYLEWFRCFARQFRRILKDDGSLVIDLGGAWKPGMPVRSLYHFKNLQGWPTVGHLQGIALTGGGSVPIPTKIRHFSAGMW